MTRIRLHRGYHPGTWIKAYHGPQTWPWWRWISFSILILPHVHKPSTGWRLWVYTRWGAAFFDVYFDRRDRWWERTSDARSRS
jgi:hypothetical protein